MTKEDEMEPCPFCGGAKSQGFSSYIGRNEAGKPTWERYRLCLDCRARGPAQSDVTGASRLWNQRATLTTPSPSGEMVERIAEACCNDILARDVADKQCSPAFEDCDGETQDFWRYIARAAIAALTSTGSNRLSLGVEEQVVDLDRRNWEALVQAASESKWMPPEYFVNDWVSDCADFLRNGHEGVRAQAFEEAAKAVAGIESPYHNKVQAPENGAYVNALDAAEVAIRALSGQSGEALDHHD